MMVKVRVIPNAKKNKITEEDGILKVRLTAPAAGGRANASLVEALSSYFQAKKSDIRIVKGRKSRQKIIEIGYSARHNNLE